MLGDCRILESIISILYDLDELEMIIIQESGIPTKQYDEMGDLTVQMDPDPS